MLQLLLHWPWSDHRCAVSSSYNSVCLLKLNSFTHGSIQSPDQRGYLDNYFSYFATKNVCCGYPLEAPQRGASNEYPQHMFPWKNKKNINIFPLKKMSYLELLIVLPAVYHEQVAARLEVLNIERIQRICLGIRISLSKISLPWSSPFIFLSNQLSNIFWYIYKSKNNLFPRGADYFF